MLRVRLYGAEGQGAAAGCALLAAAFHRAGRAAQVCTGTGGDGADAVLVLDPALLGDVAAAGLTKDAPVLVNSTAAPCSRAPQAPRTVAVDADAVAGRHGLGPFVVTAMLGVFAGVTDALPLDTLAAAVADGSPDRPDAHAAAVIEGYRLGASLAMRTPPSGPVHAR